VSGVSPSGYNGDFTVLSSTSTSVTYSKTSDPGTYTSGGEVNDLQDNQSDTTYEPDGQTATSTDPDGYAPGASTAAWTTSDTYDAAGNEIYQTDPGTTLSVSSASCSSSVVTIVYGTTTGLPVANSYVLVAGVSVSGYNGSYQVTASNADYITYGVASCPGSSGTGGTTVVETVNTYDADGNTTQTRDDQGNVTNTAFDIDDRSLATSDPGSRASVTSASCSSDVVTIDYGPTVLPPVGSYVFVTGITPTGYNGSYLATASTSTYVKYSVSSCPGSYSSGGYVAPSASGETYDANGNESTSTSYGDTLSTTTDQYDPLGRQTAETDAGFSASITGASWSSGSGGEATVDIATTQPPQAGATIIVSGVSPSGYDGAATVISSTPTTVTYAEVTNPGTYTSGGTLWSGDGYVSVTNSSWSSGSGGQATLDFATGSYPAVAGGYVTVSGMSPSGYNGTFKVVSNTSTSLTYALASNPGSFSVGGVIQPDSYTDYYPNGNTENSIDDLGSDTDTTYYPSDQQDVVTTGYGQTGATTETSTYDPSGNTLTDDDAGSTTTSTYDDNGWSVASTDQNGGETIYSHDNAGNVTTEADPQDSLTAVGATWSSGSGGQATITFGSTVAPEVGSQIIVSGISPSGYNSPIGASFTVVSSSSTTVTYALASNPGSYSSGGTVELPQVTYTTYDGANRQLSTCVDGLPSGTLCSGSGAEITSYAYDNDGNSIASNDANANSWQQTSETNLGGQDESQTGTPADGTGDDSSTTYTANGYTKTSTNADGVTTTDDYDASGRLTEISYSDGTPTVTYSYNPDGSIAEMTDGSGSSIYTYDSQGNLIEQSGTSQGTMNYTWDANGNLSTITYPEGNVVTYGYDAQNRMISMNDGQGNTTDFGYDPTTGNLSTITYPNNTVTTYSYDSQNQLDKIATTKGGSAWFSFDASATGDLNADGTMHEMTTSESANLGLQPGSSGSPGTDTYAYDSLGRLVSDSETGTGASSPAFTYANNGELDQVSGGGAPLTPGYYQYQSSGSDAGQISCFSTSSGCTGTKTYFSFDNDGNRTCVGTGTPCTSHETEAYSYDGADRLKEWTAPGSYTDDMTYNGDGLLTETDYSYPGSVCPNVVRRGSKRNRLVMRHVKRDTSRCDWTDQLTWNSALGGVPTLASDFTSATGVNEGSEDFIMGPEGMPIEQIAYEDGVGYSDPQWFYQDFQGNTRALVDSSDDIQVQNYPAYGTVSNGWAGGMETPLQYSGTYSTGWVNLVYDQARWYDPGTGQFLSTDPDVDQTLQPFAYAGDNPAANEDPTGLKSPPSSPPKVEQPIGKGENAPGQTAKWLQKRGKLALPKSM